MNFYFLKKIWCCVGSRVKQKFAFIKRVDKGRISAVRDLESLWKLRISYSPGTKLSAQAETMKTSLFILLSSI